MRPCGVAYTDDCAESAALRAGRWAGGVTTSGRRGFGGGASEGCSGSDSEGSESSVSPSKSAAQSHAPVLVVLVCVCECTCECAWVCMGVRMCVCVSMRVGFVAMSMAHQRDARAPSHHQCCRGAARHQSPMPNSELKRTESGQGGRGGGGEAKQKKEEARSKKVSAITNIAH